MRNAIRWPLVAYLLAGAACASGGASSSDSSQPRPRTDLITPIDIQRAQWANAYELVSNLRPRWLQTRGPDTITGRPGEVQVLLDGMRVGGVNALRHLPVMGIGYVQFFDPITAAGRWGLGFGNGAIYVSTQSR